MGFILIIIRVATWVWIYLGVSLTYLGVSWKRVLAYLSVS